METRAVRVVVRVLAIAAIVFLYVPLTVVVVYAFNPARGQSWPPSGFTTQWFEVAWSNPDVRGAFGLSLAIAATATLVALILGSLAAFVVHRFRFFGRESISFALILPIALPGIVTAIALSSAANSVGMSLGFLTIVVGHATFCIVVIYNNVIARLRRTAGSLTEASMDLGGDGWQTFRYVTLPSIRTALIAGALLAFGLSFDEIVVTNFLAGSDLTLPKWIFNHIREPRLRPVVNVVALVVVLLSIIPVYIAQRLTRDPEDQLPAGAEEAGPG